MSLVINHNLMARNVANNLNAHYGNLSTSTQRLSTGLRVNSASDDAAGLAIRELQRADIASFHQGARNANDAISLIQVADGALGIIDEKLIRMKELAEQAATGTYDSVQRLMIDSEFQQMASEIDRIANATDFNGVHLLDGSLSGDHDGTQLTSTGKMKVHFGSENDSAEDYYYIEIGASTVKGLGLTDTLQTTRNVTETIPTVRSLFSLAGSGNNSIDTRVNSGVIPMSYIPKGARNVIITIDGLPGAEDDIQLFTRDGYHLSGTMITATATNDFTWSHNNINSPSDFQKKIMSSEYGFEDNKYKIPGNSTSLIGSFNRGANSAETWNLEGGETVEYRREDSSSTMKITYSGDYDRYDDTPNNGDITSGVFTKEKVKLDETTEDILIIVSGSGVFDFHAEWEYMPAPSEPEPEKQTVTREVTEYSDQTVDIQTQERAQRMLTRINGAIESKDKIRASLGALQNRFENTIANINTQAENLQASESRISDVNVATEMTEFVRQQILTQSAVAMLAQANSLPQMAMQVIGT